MTCDTLQHCAACSPLHARQTARFVCLAAGDRRGYSNQSATGSIMAWRNGRGV